MSLVQYKCPNCGGSLEFNPQTQTFDCEYCMSVFRKQQIEEIFTQNESNPLTDVDVAPDPDFSSQSALYTCSNCGAEIIAEETTAATFCYYCQSPVILTGRLSNEYRPQKVMPFKLTKDDAIAAFKNLCAKRWFLPSDFTSASQLEKITGVYVPYWLADCKADGDMIALAKKVRSWTSGDRRYTETKEYRCSRKANFIFDGIPSDASSKFPDDLMEAIEPFDYKELTDFSMSYLSGFMADKYDVERNSVFQRIKERLTNGANDLMKSTITGYSSVSIENSRVDVLQTKWSYILLPVWFMTYKYGDKQFFYAINGQTAKTSGELPVSKTKMVLGGLITAFIVFLIAYFIGGAMI